MSVFFSVFQETTESERVVGVYVGRVVGRKGAISIIRNLGGWRRVG